MKARKFLSRADLGASGRRSHLRVEGPTPSRALGSPVAYGHCAASTCRQACWSKVSGIEYSICSISVEVDTVIWVTSCAPGWISRVEKRSEVPPGPTATAAAGSGGGESTLRWIERT